MAYGGWGAFLAGVAGPIAKRVMVSLGFGIVTMTGVTLAVQSAVNSAKAAFGGITGVVADLVAIAGFFSAASILAGGLVAAASMMVVKKFQLL